MKNYDRQLKSNIYKIEEDFLIYHSHYIYRIMDVKSDPLAQTSGVLIRVSIQILHSTEVDLMLDCNESITLA